MPSEISTSIKSFPAPEHSAGQVRLVAGQLERFNLREPWLLTLLLCYVVMIAAVVLTMYLMPETPRAAGIVLGVALYLIVISVLLLGARQRRRARRRADEVRAGWAPALSEGSWSELDGTAPADYERAAAVADALGHRTDRPGAMWLAAVSVDRTAIAVGWMKPQGKPTVRAIVGRTQSSPRDFTLAEVGPDGDLRYDSAGPARPAVAAALAAAVEGLPESTLVLVSPRLIALDVPGWLEPELAGDLAARTSRLAAALPGDPRRAHG